MTIVSFRSEPPASSRSTVVAASSVSRAARTDPAGPDPTMMKSGDLVTGISPAARQRLDGNAKRICGHPNILFGKDGGWPLKKPHPRKSRPCAAYADQRHHIANRGGASEAIACLIFGT